MAPRAASTGNVRSRRPTVRSSVASQPQGGDQALAVLDRIARYCEFTCAPGADACLEEGCEAWQQERAAAAYLAARWVDVQD